MHHCIWCFTQTAMVPAQPCFARQTRRCKPSPESSVRSPALMAVQNELLSSDPETQDQCTAAPCSFSACSNTKPQALLYTRMSVGEASASVTGSCGAFGSALALSAEMPKNPLSTRMAPPNISIAEEALDSQAGRLKIASKVTAKGTCIDNPTVATVGPACEQGCHTLNPEDCRSCRPSLLMSAMLGSLCSGFQVCMDHPQNAVAPLLCTFIYGSHPCKI